MTTRSLLALALLAGPSASLAAAQIQATRTGFVVDRPTQPRPDRALVVDAAGQGDFTDLQTAVTAAPDGALLLIRPGGYAGANVVGKSLRIEAIEPGLTALTSRLYVGGIGARQEVHVGGLMFDEGFLVELCAGQVHMAHCSAIDDGVTVPPPPGVDFWRYPECGIGLSRHNIVASAAVSLIDCSFEGRDGTFYPVCDGSPGEHGLVVEDSRVTIYGGRFQGGDGSDAVGCHGAYAGAGGDGVLARGASTRVLTCDVVGGGGIGGDDLELGSSHGCPGEPYRSFTGATIESCAIDHVTLEIEPLVHVGTLPTYTIEGPPGADVFLMLSPRRGWREFPASAGVLHMGRGLQTFPLGALGAGGTISRPLPAPRPAWLYGYASIELQVYARIAGQDQYSEPRTLQVIHPGP